MNVDDDISTVYSFLPGIQEYRRFGADETIEADLLVIIDASSADRAGNAMEVVRPGAVLNIDHHKTNTRFADYLYLDSDAAATAEIIYRYITGNNTFEERHTGLSDVMIEKDIFAKCLAQHKKMRKLVFAN